MRQRKRLTPRQRSALLYKTRAPIGIGLTRETAKRRADADEAAVKRKVRAECVDRDGYCRIARRGAQVSRVMPCRGPSQWAHLGDKQRFKTRGMDPEVRHTTAGSVMFCEGHHTAYDQGRLDVRELTPEGADGLLAYRLPTSPDIEYREAAAYALRN